MIKMTKWFLKTVTVHDSNQLIGLLSDFEDFTSPEENYLKFKIMKNDLVQVQKRLSKMDIIEWHEITGSLHPANHIMERLRPDYSVIPLLTQAWMKFYEII